MQEAEAFSYRKLDSGHSRNTIDIAVCPWRLLPSAFARYRETKHTKLQEKQSGHLFTDQLAKDETCGKKLLPVGAICTAAQTARNRSEERRVGKERRSRWSPYH